MTHHAIQRTRERTGLKLKSSEKFITYALARGKSAEYFSANERNYILSKETKGDCIVLVYQSFFFIIDSAGRCVTMYAVPKWFGKKKHFDGKVKIRSVKRYSRFNTMFDEDAA